MKKILSLFVVMLLTCGLCACREPSAKTGASASLSNRTVGWGLKKNKGDAPEIPKSVSDLMNEYGAYYLDKIPKTLYLTFDEGYENGYTAQILDVLKANEVKAAFFITGPYLEKETALVQRMVEEGHIVGNHTVHHPSLPSVTDDEALKKELTALSRSFEEKFGQKMYYFRPPKGEYSERTLALTNELGYKTVFWSFAYQDWDTKKTKGSEYAYRAITDYMHDGCVLLLHAVSKDNADALDRVLKDLKAQGYQFRSLDEFGTP